MRGKKTCCLLSAYYVPGKMLSFLMLSFKNIKQFTTGHRVCQRIWTQTLLLPAPNLCALWSPLASLRANPPPCWDLALSKPSRWARGSFGSSAQSICLITINLCCRINGAAKTFPLLLVMSKALAKSQGQWPDCWGKELTGGTVNGVFNKAGR